MGDAFANVVRGLTAEALSSLRAQCDVADQSLTQRAIFRGLLDHLALLNCSEGAYVDEVHDVVIHIVRAVQSALQAERSVTQSSNVSIEDEDSQRNQWERDKLRELVLAPFRAQYARALHERVARVMHNTHRSPDEPEEEKPGWFFNKPKWRHKKKHSHIDDQENLGKWKSQWAADCSAQLFAYHSLLDRLEMGEHGSENAEVEDRCALARHVISQILLERYQTLLDDDHRQLLKRAHQILHHTNCSNRAHRLVSEDEQERWRVLAATIKGQTWHSIYEPERDRKRSSLWGSGTSVLSSGSAEGGALTAASRRWLVPAHEVDFRDDLVDLLTDYTRRSRGLVGRWLESDVLFKPIQSDISAVLLSNEASPLALEIEQWYRLSHPNVAKLFGVYFDGQRGYCVCEYEEWNALDEFAQFADDSEVWELLFDAALGLQFLHASGIAHGNLRSLSIMVAADGLGHIDGIGTRASILDNSGLVEYCFDEEKVQWAAPECLRGGSGSFESDIYSFGIVIISHFCKPGQSPWGDSELSLEMADQIAQNGMLPHRPDVLNDDEWSLLIEMCAFNPTERPTISAVINRIREIIQSLQTESDKSSWTATSHEKRQTWGHIFRAATDLQYRHEELNAFFGVLSSLDEILLIRSGSNDNEQAMRPDIVFPTREAALHAAAVGHLSRRWRAPETLPEVNSNSVALDLPAKFAADVYSFGIRIIEALTRDYAWGRRTPDLVAGEAIIHGRLPRKPRVFTLRQWSLIERMCTLDPEARPSMAEVVQQLQQFAYTKETNNLEKSRSNSTEQSNTTEEGSEDSNWVDSSGSESVDDLISNIQELLERTPDLNVEANRQVLVRLTSIYERGLLDTRSENADGTIAFHDVLKRFWKFLSQNAGKGFRSDASSCSSESFPDFEWSSSSTVASAGRSYLRSNFVFHRLLDEVIAKLHINPDCLSDVSLFRQMHDWRSQWHTLRSSQLHQPIQPLSREPSIELETEGNDIDGTDKELPAWFVYPFDVDINELELLGRGSFGSVHKAVWSGASVVVKKILSVFESAEQRALFYQEVGIWYRLHHPHIIKLYGACHVGQPFFVCEYASFGRLDRYLVHRERQHLQFQDKNESNFSRVRLAWVKICEAARGLQYLHERGIVHADLKCDNILVAMDGKAKLSDFGLSRVVNRKYPNTRGDRPKSPSAHPGLGAIRWKAPEILFGESPRRASDIYSLGMCLIEAVTGMYPWGNSVPDSAVAVHVKKGCLPLQPPEFSDAEWSLVRAMCQFNANDRLHSADVVKALSKRVELDQLSTSVFA